MRTKKTKSTPQSRQKPHALDDWERSWLVHWSKAGTIGYELPKSGEQGEEAAFLSEIRTPEKEAERLERIQREFMRGFEGLYDLGPAVTVFGSARFKESHPYYKLARAVGKEFACAGFPRWNRGKSGPI